MHSKEHNNVGKSQSISMLGAGWHDCRNVVIGCYLASGAGDLLDGAHEDVGDDCHAHETVEQAHQIEEGPHLGRPRELVDERQQEALLRTSVLFQRSVSRHHSPVIQFQKCKINYQHFNFNINFFFLFFFFE